MVDLSSLLTLVAAVDAAMAFALWFGVSGKRAGGAELWSSALGVRALAIALILGAAQPQAGALALGVGLLGLSITLQAGALLAFASRALPAWVHTATFAALAVPIQMLGGDPAGATLFGGVALGALVALTAGIAWQVVGPSVTRARQLLVACLGIAALGLAGRGIAAVFVAEPLRALLYPWGAGAWIVVLLAAALLASTFGFLLLHHGRAQAEATRLATTDPLTGAYNRRTFHEIAEREMSRARRANQPLSIIMLDIDHLRRLNEDYGQKAGDEVLQRFADLVRTALRKEDMLVRFAGEQFLVMLPEVSGPGAVVVAGRIRRSVADAPIEAAGHLLPVTVSLGVAARLDEGPESVDGLVARAESALALAKQRGRNRVVALSLGRSIAA
jgi:diguanylate cyclase (GGDEF)-like protein